MASNPWRDNSIDTGKQSFVVTQRDNTEEAERDMAEIKVVEPHGTDVNDAIKRIGSFEEMMKKYGVKINWSGSKAEIKGMGVSGDIAIDETNAAVRIKLGMMARAAGVDPKRLEASIKKRLVAAFGE